MPESDIYHETDDLKADPIDELVLFDLLDFCIDQLEYDGNEAEDVDNDEFQVSGFLIYI
jgi:hypothetical protein